MTRWADLEGDVWELQAGQLYVDIGRLLARLGLPDTRENRDRTIAAVRAALERFDPRTQVVLIRVPVKRPPAPGGTAP